MELSKETLRGVLRRERDALSASSVREAAAAIIARILASPVYQSARDVVGYAAKDNEVPIEAILLDAHAAGRRVYLPRTARGHFVRHVPGETLRTEKWGLLEPSGDDPYRPGAVPGVAFVPLLAWDDQGGRLGRGAGWYDRALGGLGAAVALVGVAYEFQRRERLPITETDVALDFIVTERRLVDARPASAVAERRSA